MASISPTTLQCAGEPHTSKHAYLKLTITSISDSDAATNKRYIGWKITFEGEQWVKLYKAYCTLGGTKIYDAEPGTTGWTTGQTLVSDTTTFSNDSAGNLTLYAYLKQLFYYGTWAWGNSGYYQENSVNMVCSQLPRYANFTSHSASSELNKITVTYSADANYKAQQYSLDGGNWTNTTSGSYTLSGFQPGSTHTIKTRIQRTDSGLWTESSTLSVKCKSLPTSNSVSNVNFNSSGTRVDVSISSKDYLSSWYVKLYDGNTLVRDGSTDPNRGTSTSDYWTIDSNNSTQMLPRHTDSDSWTLTAKFYVVSNGTTYELTSRTFNCKIPAGQYTPVYNVNNISYAAIDSKTLSLNNNQGNKIIKGVSKVRVTTTPASPQGSARMVSYSATSGTKSNSTSTTTSPITIDLTAVNGSSVSVQATDSRQRSTTATKQYDAFIDYFAPVIASALVNRIDGIGTNLSVDISGRYCNWSGLATSNTIEQVSIKYRIKGSSSWTTITGITLTRVVSGGTFRFTGNITGNRFDAVNEYEVQLIFKDKIDNFEYIATIPPGKALVWKDMANSRVGIGKKPSKMVDVAGDVNVDGTINNFTLANVCELSYTVVDTW